MALWRPIRKRRLEKSQQLRGLYFGTRPVCTVLRPRFLSPAQYRLLHDSVKVLLPAFQAAYQRALAEEGFRAQFRMLDWENELLAVDPGFPDPSPTSRFDSFFASDDELYFTEFNTETPAGPGYSDALAELFYGLPVFQEFQRRFRVWPIPAKPGVLHALTDSFKQWQGNTSDAPRIAILDWREVPTFSEFVLFYDYFRSMGIETRIVDPREVEYRDGKLMSRRLPHHAHLQACTHCRTDRTRRNGTSRRASSARSRRLHGEFVPLQDSLQESIAGGTHRRAEHRHVHARATRGRCETHSVDPRDGTARKPSSTDAKSTSCRGFHATRINSVLKPNDDYGGKGIVLGWTVDQRAWDEAVQAALVAPYVVQRRVKVPHEAFPSFESGGLQVLDRMLDTNPYVAFGAFMHGCLTRISTEALVNVTAGGGSTVPTFLVEPR